MTSKCQSVFAEHHDKHLETEKAVKSETNHNHKQDIGMVYE